MENINGLLNSSKLKLNTKFGIWFFKELKCMLFWYSNTGCDTHVTGFEFFNPHNLAFCWLPAAPGCYCWWTTGTNSYHSLADLIVMFSLRKFPLNFQLIKMDHKLRIPPTTIDSETYMKTWLRFFTENGIQKLWRRHVKTLYLISKSNSWLSCTSMNPSNS